MHISDLFILYVCLLFKNLFCNQGFKLWLGFCCNGKLLQTNVADSLCGRCRESERLDVMAKIAVADRFLKPWLWLRKLTDLSVVMLDSKLSGLGLDGTLGYLLSDLMSLRDLWDNFILLFCARILLFFFSSSGNKVGFFCF